MRKVLIVVDMQNDFIDGALGTPEAQAIVPNVVEKVKNWKGMTIFTRDTHFPDYMDSLEGKKLPVPHCMIGTPGHAINSQIKEVVNPNTITIDKLTFGFENWRQALGEFGIDAEFELCGVCTDICVISNALALRMLYPDAKITVDASCCAGVTPEKHAAALEVMKSCQIDIINE